MKINFSTLILSIVFVSPLVSVSQETTAKTDSISKSQFETVFEKSDGSKTSTYEQAILYYQNLAKAFPEIKIEDKGTVVSSNEPSTES